MASLDFLRLNQHYVNKTGIDAGHSKLLNIITQHYYIQQYY